MSIRRISITALYLIIFELHGCSSPPKAENSSDITFLKNIKIIAESIDFKDSGKILSLIGYPVVDTIESSYGWSTMYNSDNRYIRVTLPSKYNLTSSIYIEVDKSICINDSDIRRIFGDNFTLDLNKYPFYCPDGCGGRESYEKTYEIWKKDSNNYSKEITFLGENIRHNKVQFLFKNVKDACIISVKINY